MDLFPYQEVRPQQDTMLAAVRKAVGGKGSLVVHAPTGLGKTAAALAPAIEQALDTKETVVFVTSRLTQHRLALSTVEEIEHRSGKRIRVVDLVGKKHMCLQKGIERLSGREFSEYCKNMREDGLCTYYERLRKDEQQSPETRSALVQLGSRAARPEHVKRFCSQPEYSLCPYEISMMLAKQATVVIADYSYLFNPSIREGFMHRIGSQLEDCIIVVDEAHNLPDRVKDLATERITTGTLSRAAREAEQYLPDHLHHVRMLANAVAGMTRGDERHLPREELLNAVERIVPVQQLMEELDRAAVQVREDRQASSLGSLADFLEAWHGPDEGYVRILRSESDRWQLSYRCLDPAVVTADVFRQARSSILMSGTLTPAEMYAELLGLPDAELLTLRSPFPEQNRLNLIVPKTTTRYKARSPRMYDEIAACCREILEAVPGNVAIFFPSYAILDEIRRRIETGTPRTVLSEYASLTREERETVLEKFRSYSGQGALLMGVMGGSFSEGVDLPGNELQTVVIVGLPLGRPDLETKALIEYYDEKFGKGWQYGYTFPAFNRTLQSAGRCIRSGTDRGAIVFLDERYTWQNYYECFPSDWQIRASLLYGKALREFFGGSHAT